MHKCHHVFALSVLSLACASTFAATPIDLKGQPISILRSFMSPQLSSLQEIGRDVDRNQTTHIRIQQKFAGHPVWSADALVHIPGNGNATLMNANADSTMNGTIYQNLETDLNGTPAYVLNEEQATRALTEALKLHKDATGVALYDANTAKKTLIVYVDQENQAHWAYLISFFSGEANGTPAVPTYILDATNFAVFAQWNDLQSLENVSAGGLGGNPKMGKISYDGTTGNYPQFSIERDSAKKQCFLKNADVIVYNAKNSGGPFSSSPVGKFACAEKDNQHQNLYWDGDLDQVNGGYSPVNDAMYIGTVIKNMYLEWYNVPALSMFGMPLKIKLNAHAKDMYGKVMDNAFFLPLTMQMYFGDGIKMFYPLTSLGVGAHEISHGFTSQHSNLTYEKQSGGLNESYSDMAAQAAEFYSTGKNSWQIGPEIVKGNGALRYMDDPTKDGKSIAHVRNYNDSLNVHYSSGVFNKVFYLIGSAKGWDTRKAFDVMVKANMDYWTANSTFNDAACGVMHATKDLNYNATVVTRAFKTVGIDTARC